LIGLFCLYFGIRKGKRLLNYADYGKATLARFMRQEITAEQSKHGVIVRMIFEYETTNGKYEIFSKTETPEKFKTQGRIVLYLPWDNGDAIFKDDLWS
jgi:formylmethanofuran dehydrogenase subunit E